MKLFVTIQTGDHADSIIHYSALEDARLTCINAVLIKNMEMVSVNATRKYEKRFDEITKRVSNHTTSRKFKA